MYKWVQLARDTKAKTSQISKKSGPWDFLKKQFFVGIFQKFFLQGPEHKIVILQGPKPHFNLNLIIKIKGFGLIEYSNNNEFIVLCVF